jgi:hypothetical protein
VAAPPRVRARASRPFHHPANLAADGVPDALLRQMTTAQTAAHEFLRQFWLSAYPPPGEVAPAPPAQKAAKAARMAGFLARTPEKVDALVREAQRLGVEVDAVSTVRVRWMRWGVS